MNRSICAVLLVTVLSVGGIVTASRSTVQAKKQDRLCACLDEGPRPRPNPVKKVRDLAGALALAAIDTAVEKDVDSEAFAAYVIDVAKRVAYGDYVIDDPTDDERE
jgi:hypothetical protein